MPFLIAAGHRLEYEWIRSGSPGRSGRAGRAPVVVFLHEGLGSVAMWRGFPEDLVGATGCDALVYSRYGYGRSDPLSSAREVGFMHDEALHTLPALLDQLGIVNPVLFGHSDGGSIALIHAGGSGRPVRGLIAVAPHVKVEEISVRSIEEARRSYETTDLRQRLGRYHDDPDSAFRGWNDIWLDPAFRSWNIEEYLPAITCPILAVQGEDDEYGTMEQIETIARLAPRVELLKLPSCGHSPHRDQPQALLEASCRFIRQFNPASQG